MSLIKVKAGSNMYQGWVTHTWSPIAGCQHQCSYCFVRQWHDLKDTPNLVLPFPNLGHGKKIFVGHLCDMFAENVPQEWISRILEWCKQFYNEYIFQTKNPARYDQLIGFPHSLLGTTIETNRQELLNKISKAPKIADRIAGMMQIVGRKFLTIEPIIDFDLDEFAEIIYTINPEFVNIGADSKGHKLLEPDTTKIESFINQLECEGIEVRRKPNLRRLLNDRT